MNVKKVALSTLFVVMLMVPTVLGAVPLTIYTPVGVVSTEVSEAEARNRNTSANRPRALSARNSGAQRVQSFSSNRTSYTINVRESTSNANIRVGLRSGQQVRWRIDTRRANGTWNNGSYNSWRSRTTSNTNRDVRVNVNQGQERRLRFQIRDRNGNIRTLDIRVRRASGNTWGANLRANTGTFNPRTFARATTNYTLQLSANRTHANVSLERAHHNANMRLRFRTQNHNGTWGPWGSWQGGGFARADWSARMSYVPYNHAIQAQFQIRGAFTNMPNTPTRTRNYNVTVRRSAHSLHQQWVIDALNHRFPELQNRRWGFSRQGLIDDLRFFERLSQADAVRAVDGVRANWNTQAVLAAERWGFWASTYGFTINRQQMISVLTDEGFTQAQATHGANAVGLTAAIAPLSTQDDSAVFAELRESARVKVQESLGQRNSEDARFEATTR